MIILLIFRELTLTWNIEMKQSYLPNGILNILVIMQQRKRGVISAGLR